MTIELIHPDDILFFDQVRNAMFEVAREYKLPLRAVEVTPNATLKESARGTCSIDGHICLTLRCRTAAGEWTAPMSPEQVWKTAGHELAHLKHFNHGLKFQEFELEMQEAMKLRIENKEAKIIDKIVKLQQQADGEAKLGNSAAAEAFAAMANKLLLDYELSASDLDYKRQSDKDPIIEKTVNFGAYKMKRTKVRIWWQEELAGLIARSHLCRLLIHPHGGGNTVTFVGTRTHATVAEYVFGTMVPAVDKMADVEYYAYYDQMARQGRGAEARGYRKGWLNAFVQRIGERFDEERRASIARAKTENAMPESQSLMRLGNSMQKVNEYIDNKFKSRRGGYAGELKFQGNHQAGLRDGRAAADRINLGRRGLNADRPVRGHLS